MMWPYGSRSNEVDFAGRRRIFACGLHSDCGDPVTADGDNLLISAFFGRPRKRNDVSCS
jgi:hypothetical protein